MDEINELIESLLVDTAGEGIGTMAGMSLLWGLFFCGAYAGFTELLNLLASMI